MLARARRAPDATERAMTAETLLILAAGAQVALTIFAVMRMGTARIRALKGREVGLADVSLDTRNYPEPLHKLQNNTTNQFETPVLFFAAVATALAADLASFGLAALALAWLVTRAIHMAIHTGSNNVIRRFNSFLAGLLILGAMWVEIVAEALAG
jgi:hypothetical protein